MLLQSFKARTKARISFFENVVAGQYNYYYGYQKEATPTHVSALPELPTLTQFYQTSVDLFLYNGIYYDYRNQIL